MIEVHFEILDAGTGWGMLNPVTGHAEIKWLFVTYHRHGYGRRLLEALEVRLAHHGAHEVHVVADAIDASVASASHIPQLVKWYERRGYSHIGEQYLIKKLPAPTAP